MKPKRIQTGLFIPKLSRAIIVKREFQRKLAALWPGVWINIRQGGHVLCGVTPKVEQRLFKCYQQFKKLKQADPDYLLFLLQIPVTRASERDGANRNILTAVNPKRWEKIKGSLSSLKKDLTGAPDWEQAIQTILDGIGESGRTRKDLSFEVRDCRKGHSGPFSAETQTIIGPGMLLCGYSRRTNGRPSGSVIDGFGDTAWLISGHLRETAEGPHWRAISKMFETLELGYAGEFRFSQDEPHKWPMTLVKKFLSSHDARFLKKLESRWLLQFQKAKARANRD